MKFEHRGHEVELDARGHFVVTVRNKTLRCASLDAAKKRVDEALAEAAKEKPPVRGFSIGYRGSIREATILRTEADKRSKHYGGRTYLVVKWDDEQDRGAYERQTAEKFFTHDDPKVVKATIKKLRAIAEERTRVLRELRERYDAALAEMDVVETTSLADYHDGRRRKAKPDDIGRGGRDDLP